MLSLSSARTRTSFTAMMRKYQLNTGRLIKASVLIDLFFIVDSQMEVYSDIVLSLKNKWWWNWWLISNKSDWWCQWSWYGALFSEQSHGNIKVKQKEHAPHAVLLCLLHTSLLQTYLWLTVSDISTATFCFCKTHARCNFKQYKGLVPSVLFTQV